MKKFLKILGIAIGIKILIIVGILYYHGFFTEPVVTEKEVGPYTIAVKRFIGGYYQVGPTMTEVDSWIRGQGVSSTKGIGLFYDDPGTVEESKLRSDVGNVLEGVDEQTIETIKMQLEVKELPVMRAVVIDFPIVSPLSYMIAPMKVYPAISKYWKEKGYPEEGGVGYSIELYDMPGKITTYVMPIPGEQ